MSHAVSELGKGTCEIRESRLPAQPWGVCFALPAECRRAMGGLRGQGAGGSSGTSQSSRRLGAGRAGEAAQARFPPAEAAGHEVEGRSRGWTGHPSAQPPAWGGSVSHHSRNVGAEAAASPRPGHRDSAGPVTPTAHPPSLPDCQPSCQFCRHLTAFVFGHHTFRANFQVTRNIEAREKVNLQYLRTPSF